MSSFSLKFTARIQFPTGSLYLCISDTAKMWDTALGNVFLTRLELTKESHSPASPLNLSDKSGFQSL